MKRQNWNNDVTGKKAQEERSEKKETKNKLQEKKRERWEESKHRTEAATDDVLEKRCS